MAGWSKERKRRSANAMDNKDAEILAILAVNPDAKNRAIAHTVGLSESAVCRRRQKYPGTDWFQNTLKELHGLCPDGIKAIRKKIKDDAYLAVKVFFGLGILRHKHDLEHSGGIKHDHTGGIRELASSLAQEFSAERIREIIDSLRNGPGDDRSAKT